MALRQRQSYGASASLASEHQQRGDALPSEYENRLDSLARGSGFVANVRKFQSQLKDAMVPSTGVLYDNIQSVWLFVVLGALAFAAVLFYIGPIGSTSGYLNPTDPAFCFDCSNKLTHLAAKETEAPLLFVVLSGCERGMLRQTARESWAGTAASVGHNVIFGVSYQQNDENCKSLLQQEAANFKDVIAVPVADGGDASQGSGKAGRAGVEFSAAKSEVLLRTLQQKIATSKASMVVITQDDVFVDVRVLAERLVMYNTMSGSDVRLKYVGRFVDRTVITQTAKSIVVPQSFQRLTVKNTLNHTAPIFISTSTTNAADVKNVAPLAMVSMDAVQHVVAAAAMLDTSAGDWRRGLDTWLSSIKMDRISDAGLVLAAAEASRPRSPHFPPIAAQCEVIATHSSNAYSQLDADAVKQTHPAIAAVVRKCAGLKRAVAEAGTLIGRCCV